MFSLGLISPYYWGNTLLGTLCFPPPLSTARSPMNLEVFKSSQWGQTLFPVLCECQSITSNLFGRFFLWAQIGSLHVCADRSSAEYSSGNLLKTSRISFSAPFPPFLYSALAALTSSDSQLCLLKSPTLPGSAWAPLLCTVTCRLSSLKAVSGG